jgi:hypothetical protein
MTRKTKQNTDQERRVVTPFMVFTLISMLYTSSKVFKDSIRMCCV